MDFIFLRESSQGDPESDALFRKASDATFALLERFAQESGGQLPMRMVELIASAKKEEPVKLDELLGCLPQPILRTFVHEVGRQAIEARNEFHSLRAGVIAMAELASAGNGDELFRSRQVLVDEAFEVRLERNALIGLEGLASDVLQQVNWGY